MSILHLTLKMYSDLGLSIGLGRSFMRFSLKQKTRNLLKKAPSVAKNCPKANSFPISNLIKFKREAPSLAPNPSFAFGLARFSCLKCVSSIIPIVMSKEITSLYLQNRLFIIIEPYGSSYWRKITLFTPLNSRRFKISTLKRDLKPIESSKSLNFNKNDTLTKRTHGMRREREKIIFAHVILR